MVKVITRPLDSNIPFKMGERGYLIARGENVVAFYLDAWTDTGRAYPVSTCDQVYFRDTKTTEHYPSIMVEDGNEDSTNLAEIHFPEFEGWKVHSVDGGKTMAICLVKMIDMFGKI